MEKLKHIKRLLVNARGLTLIEVLAAIVLLSIILAMVTSVYLLGVKQYKVQTQNINSQENVRLAMTVLTKAIRSASSVQVVDPGTPSHPSDDQLKLTTGTQTDVYALDQTNIDKNGKPLVQGVSQFIVSQVGTEVSLKIESVPDPLGHPTSLQTTIYIRQ